MVRKFLCFCLIILSAVLGVVSEASAKPAGFQELTIKFNRPDDSIIAGTIVAQTENGAESISIGGNRSFEIKIKASSVSINVYSVANYQYINGVPKEQKKYEGKYIVEPDFYKNSDVVPKTYRQRWKAVSGDINEDEESINDKPIIVMVHGPDEFENILKVQISDKNGRILKEAESVRLIPDGELDEDGKIKKNFSLTHRQELSLKW